MNKSINNKNIKEIYNETIKCASCGHNAHFKVVEISDKVFPECKIETVLICYNCGFKNIEEHSKHMIKNEMKISCTFKSKEDLQRRIYLNNKSRVILKDTDKSEIYSLECEDAYVDTLETLLVRLQDKIGEMTDSEKIKTETLDNVGVLQKIDEMRKTGVVNLEIHDESGISRVLPVGIDKIQGELSKEPENEDGKVRYVPLRDNCQLTE
ncbi:hypothetical protein EHP00_1234 [Ecytonucleospora hepatopenaei]|uniref:Uncharacterized protein n=1 Tax=Ecytonucleospora hepatopenaei TaxID=646526 RepID=A0A1W0E3K1_9MICR|nr:hypothetical protein EHP00_1234 [Ecytonucleospora hepatopenaei]